MKRKVLILSLLILNSILNITLLAENRKDRIKSKSETELSNIKDSLKIELNRTITITYLDSYLEGRGMPPLKYFGYEKVVDLQESNPEINKMWQDYTKATQESRDYRVEHDPVYRDAKAKYLRKEISKEQLSQATKANTKYIWDNHGEGFKAIVNKARRLMKEYNVTTIKIRISESTMQRKIFPIDWIPSDKLKEAKQTSEVKDISDQIELIEKELLKRIKNK